MASQASYNASVGDQSHEPDASHTQNILQDVPTTTAEKERLPSIASSTTSSRTAMGKNKRKLRYNPPPSSSGRNTLSSGSVRSENYAASQRTVRTLPPWISSYDEDDEDEDLFRNRPSSRLLTPPSRAVAAQHHHDQTSSPRRTSIDGFVDDYEEAPQAPNGKKPNVGGIFGHKEPVKGRKWDHVRDGDPVIVPSNDAGAAARWRVFTKSTVYNDSPNEEIVRVDEDFLQNQTPGYYRPWKGDLDGADEAEKQGGIMHNKKKRRSILMGIQHLLITHPLVPLVFRLIVLTTSIIALGISASIYHLSELYTYDQNPSTTMAIVVDVVGIPYILYVTWDEYTGKPLGLRSPKAKIRLVLLDLFFIIFESANLALAFGALTDDTGSCQMGQNGTNDSICGRVKALCAILMLALLSWSMTFSVSIFRLVERVGQREESD